MSKSNAATAATFMTQLSEMLDAIIVDGRWDCSMHEKASAIRENMRRNGLLFIPSAQEIRFDDPVKPVAPDVAAVPMDVLLTSITQGLTCALHRYPDLSVDDISDLMGAFELTSMVIRRSQPKQGS